VLITCSVCGTINPDGTQYCEGCGVELSPETQATIPQPDTASQTPSAPASSVEREAAPETEAESAPRPSSASSGEDFRYPPESPSQEAEVPSGPVAEPFSDVTPSPAPAATTTAKLLIKRYGAVTSEAIPLQGQRMVVGRFDPSTGPVDIDVTGMPGAERISRQHAEIYAESGVWKVRDLGSTNGIFIKRAGESGYSPRLQEPSELNDGDEVAFGNVVFVFRQDES
jgi:hypothetical protein